jgi:polyisoprenoid-binding protein YceI
MKTQQFKVSGSKSLVNWTGRKVTGAHNGTIAVKEGNLIFKDGALTEGRFVIDTRSIIILDVTDPATNAQFAGHLASDDFFSSEQYPEAVFQTTSIALRSADAYRITGNLTIKGITHPATFDARIKVSGPVVRATGEITIDRTLYGIKFRSGNFFKDLGDTLIYNEFDLNVSLIAEAVSETVNA